MKKQKGKAWVKLLILLLVLIVPLIVTFVVLQLNLQTDLRMGTVSPQKLDDFLASVKTALGCDGLRYVRSNEQVHRVADWDRYPASMDVREFYGGDLQGVIDKLDYLKDLGVEVIYFNPIFI